MRMRPFPSRASALLIGFLVFSVGFGVPAAILTESAHAALFQCDDGIDNDGDGWVDYPSDRGCTSYTDSSEYDYYDDYRYNDRYYRDSYYYDDRYYNSRYTYGERPDCDDGIDNDRDGWIDYPEDQNCSSYADNSEYGTSRGTNRECDDGIDNDRDGRTDYPRDTGCSSYSDDNESNTSSRYNDRYYDRYSYSYSSRHYSSSRYECDDGRDNDGDGWVDYPDDPSCSGYTDNNERSSSRLNRRQCDDGIDNDRDGWIDYPDDPSCSSYNDTSENTYNDRFSYDYQDRYFYGYRDRYIDDRDYGYNERECDDGRDNDGDGWYDYPDDPGCSGYTDDSEGSTRSQRPQCDDGRDNDGDGRIDYPSDRGCSSFTDRSEAGSARRQYWDDDYWPEWDW